MFFSSRVVPHTPPSLVKSSSIARGVMIGADSSVPSSDHVPELRNAVASPVGTAVKAEPVSWHAGVTIGTPASDRSASLRSGPSTVPGSTMSGSSRVGMSSSSSSSLAHVRFTASTHCVVVAFVYSAFSVPDSHRFRISGIVANRCEAAIASGVFLHAA